MNLFSKLRLRSHTRLFLIFILTFIIPLTILTLVFLQSYRTIYNNEVQQSSQREMDSVSTIIDTQFQTAASYISMISQNQDIVQHLLGYTTSEPAYSLGKIIRSYAIGKPSLLNSQVIILSQDREVVWGKEHIGMLSGMPEFYNLIQTSYRSPLKSTIWFSDQQFRNCPMNDAYIYVARPITDSSNWNVLGYALLRFRNSDIVSMYLTSAKKHRSIFVLDSSGKIISAVDNLDVQNSMVTPSGAQLLLTSEPFSVDGSLVYTSKLFNLWYVVSVTKLDAAAHTQLNSSIALYVAALILCIAITLAVSYITSKHFMAPIKILTSRMQDVEKGNLHSRAIIETHDEFEDLANSYNKMIQRVEDLMRQIIFEQEQKRESDIRMLQAQINPHFLYNTLASIRYMIYTFPPKEVDEILLALSRFLKYVLSNAETVHVTLDREFEQLDNYITIQQVGFDTPLQYHVDIEEGLGHCLIVKMLFQPLIENAILHGLKLNKNDPTLLVKVWSATPDTVQIDICDNGAGFDVSTLSSMPSDSKAHHLGISNVQQRIWLHYGESGHFDIQSTKGQGTIISIKIPKLTEEDMRNENTNRG